MVIYRIISKGPRLLIIGPFMVILVCLFISCDSAETETANKFGSLAFQVEWEMANTSSASDNTDQVANQTAFDCEGNGVFWINMIVYNSSNQYLTESEQWPCGAHAGTIGNIPVGSDLTIVIFGKNAANEILYRGYKSNVDISENQVTDAGLLKMYYFVPTDGNDTNCETTVNHSWKAVQSAASYEFQMATDVFFTSIDGSMTVDGPKTGCIPHPDSSGHYWRVRAIDFDGLKSAWSQIWVHGSPLPPGPPPAPTGGTTVGCNDGTGTRFNWAIVPAAASYELQISIPAGDATFTNFFGEIVANPPSQCLGLTGGDNPYYWRIRTIGQNGLLSVWSQVWNF